MCTLGFQPSEAANDRRRNDRAALEGVDGQLNRTVQLASIDYFCNSSIHYPAEGGRTGL